MCDRLCMLGVIQIRVNTWVSARKITTSFTAIVVTRVTVEPFATSVSLLH